MTTISRDRAVTAATDAKVLKVLEKAPKGVAWSAAEVARRAKFENTYTANDSLNRLADKDLVIKFQTSEGKRKPTVFLVKGRYQI